MDLGDLTGYQLQEREVRIEAAAALALGRIQFEFSRLDVALGLCAVWVDEGANLEELTPKVEAMSFHRKLEFVGAAVERRVRKNSPSHRNYKEWLQRANAARLLRNELVHGRWYIDPRTEEAVNIIGLPTSEGQHEKRYSVALLEQHLQELKRLQSQLYTLRRQKPL
jgi:hypothetical protein